MSVYNRKMFKPRNARNALNQSAGIAPVQTFHAGGPVGHTHQGNIFQRFINAPNTLSGVVSALRGNATPAAPATQPMNPVGAARNASPTLNARMNVLQGRGTAPLRQTMNSGSATINLDPSSLSGIGSILSRSPQPEQSFRDFYGGGLKSMVTNPNPMTVGQQTRSDLAGMAATPVDAVVGGVASGMDVIGDLLSPLTSDELTPGFVAAVVSGKQSLPDSVKQQINNREISVPKALSDALLSGKVDSTGVDLAKLSGFQTSQEVADVVEIMNAAPGSQTVAVERPVPPETELGRDPGPVEDEAIAALAPPPGTGDLSQDRMFMGDADATAAAAAEAEAEAAAAAARTNTNPNAGASITAPKPKPENFAEIVAQAKAANAKDGVPPLTSTQQEVDVASQKGTGSPEDIKAEFLKLLPKYEEDPSIQGLNIAMMGFAIAGGESSSAMKNIADGMKKTLPAFIKSKEKRKAFERETDLLASKYAIQRKEADRTRGLTEKDYFVKTAFTSPDGRNFEVGQPVSLSRDAFKLMEQQGLTGNLTTSSIFLEEAKAKTKAAQGLGYKEINALYKNETREFGGVKYDILVPTPYGIKNGATSTVLASENDLPVLTNAYVTNLDKINALDLGVQEARGLVATGEATGGKAVIGNLFDGLRGAGMNGILKSIGFTPPEELSTAGQYAKVHGVLAMQLAPILLGESGKTISNVDRVRVATALGYEASIDNNGNAIINLAGGPSTLFQSKEQADAALVEVQKVLRNRAREEHAKYRGVMTSIGQEFEERKVDENTQSALTQGLGGSLVMGEDNIYDIVPAG